MTDGADLKNIRYIAEFGGGTGCITKEILRKSGKDAKVLCFEKDKKLYEYIKGSIKDKRLFVINDDAQNIRHYMEKHNIRQFDCIFSGLPFSNLGAKKKLSIFYETKKALKNKGKFIFFKYIPNFEMRLHDYFKRSSVRFIFLNIPPAMVYVCDN